MTEPEQAALEQRLASMKSGNVHGFVYQNHHFQIVMTTEDGLHTGRARFFVGCETCAVFMHAATTGVVPRIEQHIDSAERARLERQHRFGEAFDIGQLRAQLAEPVPMRLRCPECHELDTVFATKPHHTHACQFWRPAIVATVGVKFLPGFKDEEPST